MPHIHVKTRVRTAAQRLKAAEMNRIGMTNEAIATELGVSTRMVIKYLHQYLEIDSRYPPSLTPDIVELMRSEERETLESYQRNIAKRVAALDEFPETFEDRARAIEVVSKAADAYGRISARKSALFGLDAPKEGNGSGSVTATQINVGGQVDEVQFLKNLVRYKELKQTNGDK